ncbi:hypothetical protein WAI453_001558 [Rhynchosporium graminicola]
MITLEGLAPSDVACRSQILTEEKRVPPVHELQGFEWIPHDDVGARKCARAHVTRGFRRKAAQAQLLLNSGSEVSQTPKRNANIGSKEKAISNVVKGMVLQKTLGHDPYATFPVKLCPNKRELRSHLFFGQGPLSFVGDNRAGFQPITKLVFDVGLYRPSGFHAIMATAANHVAASRELRISVDGLTHQQTAISLVNKMLSVWQPDRWSESLVSITLLAMLEVCYVLVLEIRGMVAYQQC